MISKLRRPALIVTALAVILSCWLPWMDRHAEASAHAGFQRALTTFALARSLGAVLSVAQGTQVNLEPGGVGMSFTPGQALQPINELVDKFADVMPVASVAFGVQIFLLEIGSHAVVSLLLTVAILGWVTLSWRPAGIVGQRWLQPALVALLLIRLAVPFVSMANEAVYTAFMSHQYDAAVNLDQLPAPVETEKGGWLDMEILRDWKSKIAEYRASYPALLHAAATWSDKIVRLMVIFVIQTVVLPLGLATERQGR